MQECRSTPSGPSAGFARGFKAQFLSGSVVEFFGNASAVTLSDVAHAHALG